MTFKKIIMPFRVIFVDLWYVWAVVVGVIFLKFGIDKSVRWIEKKLEERWVRKHQNLTEWRKASGRKFEKIIAAVFRELSYKSKVVGGAGDQGIDVILKRDGNKYLVQCKRMKKVKPGDIRAFWGSIEESIKKKEAKKGFSLIAGAGVLYLLSHSFEMTGLVVDKAAWLEMWGSYLFGLIGWIFVLVGALTVAYKLSMEE